MKDANTITLKAGEKQLSNIASVKAYFSGVLPTGVTVPLGSVKGLRREWSRHADDSESIFPMRYSVTSYIAFNKLTLQMLMIYSRIGNRKAVSVLNIEVNNAAPKIRINGYSGFGEFVGRGIILNPDAITEEIEVLYLESGADTDNDASAGLIF